MYGKRVGNLAAAMQNGRGTSGQAANFLLTNYSPTRVGQIRQRLAKDFAGFNGGYPSYLQHIARTIEMNASNLPVSAGQLESYKTLQNFLEKGLNARTGTLRFLHAYLELKHSAPLTRHHNFSDLERQGREIQLKHFPSFLEPRATQHNRKSTRVFGLYHQKDVKIFGDVADKTVDEIISDNEITDLEEMEQIEEANTRYLALALTPSSSDSFDIAHAIFYNPFLVETEFDQFRENLRTNGVKAAVESVSIGWISNYLVGFCYWDGYTFEGVLASEHSEHIIKTKGFGYYRAHGSGAGSDLDLYDNPFEKRANVPQADLRRWMNFEYENVRTTLRNSSSKASEYKSSTAFLPKDFLLPWELDQFDPQGAYINKDVSDRSKGKCRSDKRAYYFPSVRLSDYQLVQAGPPYDHPCRDRKTDRGAIGHKAAILIKLVLRKLNLSSSFNLPERLDW